MVSQSERRRDPWDLPALLLWIVFLLFGLGVEPVYLGLRDFAGVASLNALVNVGNSIVLSLILAIYVARFGLIQSREARPDMPALDRFSQIGLLGFIALVAFWWLPYGVIFTLKDMDPGLDDMLRMYILTGVAGAACIKTLCWLYLLSLMVRFYALGQKDVFGRMFGAGPREEAAAGEEPAPNVVELGSYPSDRGEARSKARTESRD